MRTETTTRTLYTFSELSEKAKGTARQWYCEGALDYDWWDCIYEDAARAGLKITGFDLDRNKHVDGNLTMSLVDSCKAILADHGPTCDTYTLASDYLTQYNQFDNKKDEAIRTLTPEDIENEKETDILEQFEVDIEELEKDYTYALREEYASILQKECDYLLSDESVEETIKANDYEFTEDGNIA